MSLEDTLRGFYPYDPTVQRLGMNRIMRLAQAECPVFYSDRGPGTWYVTRYRDICAVLADAETFSSDPYQVAGPHRLPPFEYDGDDHARIRRLLMRGLSGRSVNHMSELINGAVGDVLGACLARGEFDAVAEFALAVPVRVLASSFELPGVDEKQLLDIAAVSSTRALDPDHRDERRTWLAELGERLWRRPGTTVSLINCQIDRSELTEDEYLGLIYSLFTAGVDPVAHAIAALLEHLHLGRVARSDMSASAERRSRLVEESLRTDSPLQFFLRRARRPARIGDRSVAAGEFVSVVPAAGNVDPAVFRDADSVDLDRRNAHSHLSFGYGPHKCVGAALARMELDAVVASLAGVVDRIHPVEPPRRAGVGAVFATAITHYRCRVAD